MESRRRAGPRPPPSRRRSLVITRCWSYRAILAELTRDELRTKFDHYELEVKDRRVNAQLVDALVHSRRASLDEILQALSLARIMHQGPDPGRDTRASVW